MIDTIKLFFREFKVNPDHKLEIKRYKSEKLREFFLPGINKNIFATSISYYDPETQIRVRITPDTGYLPSLLMVAFEIPKLSGGQGLAVINVGSNKKAFSLVDEVLTRAGLQVVLDALKISSIHLKKDILSTYPLSEIQSLFQMYFRMKSSGGRCLKI